MCDVKDFIKYENADDAWDKIYLYGVVMWQTKKAYKIKLTHNIDLPYNDHLVWISKHYVYLYTRNGKNSPPADKLYDENGEIVDRFSIPRWLFDIIHKEEVDKHLDRMIKRRTAIRNKRIKRNGLVNVA